MIVVLGEREVNEKKVAIRDRREKRQYELGEAEFIQLAKEKMSEVNF